MSTITYSGGEPISFPQSLLETETEVTNLEQAEKLVVDDVVHIDHAHAINEHVDLNEVVQCARIYHRMNAMT